MEKTQNSNTHEKDSNPQKHSQDVDQSNTGKQDESHIDRNEVLSEFGGPEDFTEHLSEYMLGIRQWKKPTTNEDTEIAHKDEYAEDGTHNLDSQVGAPQAFNDNHAGGIDEESLFEPASSSTPPSRRSGSVRVRSRDVSPEVPSPVLQNPKTRSNSASEQDLFQRVSALQAELERMRSEEQKRLQRQEDLEQENDELRKENDEAHKRFEEIEKLSQPDLESTDHQKSGVDEAELGKARATIDNLKEALHTTRSKLDNVQAEYEEMIDTESEEIAQLRLELEEQKSMTEMERNKSFVIAREAAKLAETKEQNEVVIKNLQDEAKTVRSDFDQAQGELQETRRILREVEEENESLHQNAKELTSAMKELRDQAEAKAVELRAAHVSIAEFRAKSNDDAPRENIDEQQAAKIKYLQEEHDKIIDGLKTQNAKDIDKLATALKTATQSRQKNEAELKRAHALEMADLQKRIATLEQAEEAPSTHSIEDELRTAIRVLNSKLSAANSAARSARLDAEAARREAVETAEINRSVNEELEKRFSHAIEKREAEWHRRVQLLFKERDKMGKALLREWGRDEIGKKDRGERQAYRYKYVKR